MANETKLTQADMEEQFRESLKDIVTVCDKLKNSCQTVEELEGVCRLALENDGQLKLLYFIMAQQIKK